MVGTTNGSVVLRLKDALNNFDPSSKEMRTLKFSARLDGRSSSLHEDLAEIKQFPAQIHTLELFFVKRSDIQKLSTWEFTALQTLSAKNCMLFHTIKNPSALLKEMKMDLCQFTDKSINEYCNSTLAIHLERCSKVDTGSEPERCTAEKLRRLFLWECGPLMCGSILPALEEFSVNGDFGMMLMPRVRKLVFHNVLLSQSLEHMLSRLPHIRHLQIVTPLDPNYAQGIMSVIKRHKQLKRVDVEHMQIPKDNEKNLLILNDDCLATIMEYLIPVTRVWFSSIHERIWNVAQRFKNGTVQLNSNILRTKSPAELKVVGLSIENVKFMDMSEQEFYKAIVHFRVLKKLYLERVPLKRTDLLDKLPKGMLHLIDKTQELGSGCHPSFLLTVAQKYSAQMEGLFSNTDFYNAQTECQNLKELFWSYKRPPSFNSVWFKAAAKSVTDAILMRSDSPCKFPRMEKLKGLTLSCSAFEVSMGTFVPENFPSLKEVEINECKCLIKTTALLKGLPSTISKLQIDEKEPLFTLIPKLFPGLEELELLADPFSGNPRAYVKLCCGLPKLKKFTVANRRLAEILVMILKKVPSLEAVEAPFEFFDSRDFEDIIKFLGKANRKFYINKDFNTMDHLKLAL